MFLVALSHHLIRAISSYSLTHQLLLWGAPNWFIGLRKLNLVYNNSTTDRMGSFTKILKIIAESKTKQNETLIPGENTEQ
jgi:hypothetical protein